MANEEHLSILRQGARVWNLWRYQNPEITPDLTNSNLKHMDLNRVNFAQADLRGVRLDGADLCNANFSNANALGACLDNARLEEADFSNTNLSFSSLRDAHLEGAYLPRVNLYESNAKNAVFQFANLMGANLSRGLFEHVDFEHANLAGALLVETNLDRANLENCKVYGCSVWNVSLEGTNQHDLLVWRGHFDEACDLNDIAGPDALYALKDEFPLDYLVELAEPSITVDNLMIAQFLYVILNNESIRDVLETITSKAVLILGRFSLQERKAVLNALRNKLREYNLVPIVFDFDRPTNKDFTETIKTLPGLSCFVIADVTNPKSSPLELQATVPDYQIPFVPIIQEGESPFAMMVDLQKKYNWVLNTVSYDSEETLMKVLKPLIIDPAMKKRQELRLIKAQEPEVISGKDFLVKGKIDNRKKKKKSSK